MPRAVFDRANPRITRTLGRRSDLQGLIRRLASAVTVEDVATVVAARAAAPLEADFATVAVPHAKGDVQLYMPPMTDRRLVARWALLQLSDSFPLTDAIRTRRVVLLANNADRAEKYPDLVAQLEGPGWQASASLPLVAEGEVLGAVGFAWTLPQRFSADQMSRLVDVASLCAQAIWRARVTDGDVRFARSLQQLLLPRRLPTVSWLDVTTRYKAYNGDRAGGDWYDAVEFDDGGVIVVIGDVAGHGAAAARTMGKLRHALKALCVTTTDPGELLSHLNHFVLDEREDEMATACLMYLRPDSPIARVSIAGHPPPVSVTAAGDAALIKVKPHPPLGVTDIVYGTSEVDLSTSVTLVLYTDGLIERRGETLDRSFARLVQACRESAMAGPEAIDELMALLSVESEDDVAMMVLTRRVRD